MSTIALPSGINTVFVCPNLELRDLVIKVIQETSGIKPVRKSDSESAQRAHYAPATAEVIVNTAPEAMHDLLGRTSVALALRVDDRVAAAKIAAMIFAEAGYSAKIQTHAEPEFPDGFVVFVSVKALNGIVLMFWPKPEHVTPELLAHLPKQEPWDAGD